jgi:hypothetical protein
MEEAESTIRPCSPSGASRQLPHGGSSIQIHPKTCLGVGDHYVVVGAAAAACPAGS